jgi:hypothetical protein
MSRNAKPRNPREAEDRERALAALAMMRRHEATSLRAAAKAKKTDLKTVKRYVGSALPKDKHGHYHTTLYDRIPRTLSHLTPQGMIPVTVRDSRTASKIAVYSNAVGTYRRTGDSSALTQFKGKSFRAGGVVHRFVTDPDTIDLLEDVGLLTAMESLYYAQVAL